MDNKTNSDNLYFENIPDFKSSQDRQNFRSDLLFINDHDVHNSFIRENELYASSRTDSIQFATPKRKKLRKMRVLIFIVVAVVCMLVVAKNVRGREDIYDNYSVSSSYGNAPKIWTDYEIEENLRLLSNIDERYEEIYDNMEYYPHDLLQSLCNNPEILDFTLGYLSHIESGDDTLTSKETREDTPLFLQWDTRWGYEPYGDDIIALSGCGPTCLSMVVVSLTGNTEATPKAVADFAMSGGYYEIGSGTMWSLMTEGCYNYGVQSEELPLDKSKIFDELRDGKMIICSMYPGDFTTMGHFIVLCGIEGGKIKVHDPNSISRSERLWRYEELDWQIRNLWVFS